jgi:hypothetical protein
MSDAEVVRAMGVVLKDAAGSGEADEFRRSQTLSAYSVARHLAAEQEARPRLEAEFRADLAALTDGEDAARVQAATGPAELGALACELLAGLRARPEDAEARHQAAELRAALRRLCDAELAALADAA